MLFRCTAWQMYSFARGTHDTIYTGLGDIEGE